jgi:hypothetical protein
MTATDEARATGRTSRWRERAAIVLILAGSLAAFGVLPEVHLVLILAGLIWLWRSNAWSTGEKLAATFILPASLSFVIVWTLIAFNNTTRECVSFGGPMRCVTHDPGFGWGFALGALAWAAATIFVLARLVTGLQRATE